MDFIGGLGTYGGFHWSWCGCAGFGLCRFVVRHVKDGGIWTAGNGDDDHGFGGCRGLLGMGASHLSSMDRRPAGWITSFSSGRC